MAIPRIVAVLALAAVSLLVAAFASAFVGPEGGHRALGRLATGAAAGVHGLSALVLARSSRRIAARSRRSGLPAWAGAQAERDRGKAAACQALGLLTLALAAGSGWLGSSGWHRVLAGLALGFQPGALLVEGLMVGAQGRLARRVEGMAGEV